MYSFCFTEKHLYPARQALKKGNKKGQSSSSFECVHKFIVHLKINLLIATCTSCTAVKYLADCAPCKA